MLQNKDEGKWKFSTSEKGEEDEDKKNWDYVL